LTGLLADPSAAFLTRLNKGVYEPEFRLVLIIPQLIFGGAGLIGFGITAEDASKYGWFWPDFFFALVVLGMVCGAVGSALYIVDAHRDMAVEAFTCLLVFKNLFAFALTFKGFDWIVAAGRKGQGLDVVFRYVGIAQIAVCLLTIPMCKSSFTSFGRGVFGTWRTKLTVTTDVFGKKNRSFTFRHNVYFKATDGLRIVCCLKSPMCKSPFTSSGRWVFGMWKTKLTVTTGVFGTKNQSLSGKTKRR
jgi:hypothetical protein